jgi:predicted ATPase
VRGQSLTARTLAEQLLELAHMQDDPNPLMLAQYMSGLASFYHGELSAAQESFERGLVLHNRQQHQTQAALYGIDLEVASLAYMGRTLWLLGFPDRALETIQSALDVAHELPHPYSLEHTLVFATHIHQLRREVDATQEQGEAALALANKHGFRLFGAWGTIPWGWALALSGQVQAGIDQIRDGLATHTATGAELLSPYFLALLAETYGQAGRVEEGLKVVNEALSVIARNREHQWEAELLRLKGELLVSHSGANRMEADTCLHQGLALASHQQAKSLELRAATSLARLWQSQGKRQDAYDLLAPVYDWFTEGFDTVDLQEAKRVLGDLS